MSGDERELCGIFRSAGEKLDLDDAKRRIRTPEEMAAEAAELRPLFRDL